MGQRQHVVAQPCLKQRIGQGICGHLGGGDGQQVYVGIGVPVTARQRAEQPNLSVCPGGSCGGCSLA